MAYVEQVDESPSGLFCSSHSAGSMIRNKPPILPVHINEKKKKERNFESSNF